MPQEPLDGRKWKDALGEKNARHTKSEFVRLKRTLTHFKDKGLLTIEEALEWVDAQIVEVEKDIPKDA